MKLIKTTVEGFDEPQFGLRTNYNERHIAQNAWFFWRQELKLWIAPTPRHAAIFISRAETEEIADELGELALDLAFTWNRVRREGQIFVFEGDRRLAKRVHQAGFEFNSKLKTFETAFVKNALKIRDLAITDAFLAELHKTAENNNLAIARSRAASAVADIPAPEKCEYLPYQRAGILYASERPNTLIADEPGLGKTVQALGVVNLKGSAQVRRVIILCPANLKINWLREASKWLLGDYSIGIAQGDHLPDTDIVIINFDIVARHVRRLQEMNADVYIVDEAHYLKNPETKRSQAALSIDARCKLFLTGTPILNRPVDLFPLLATLDPDRWSNFWTFAKRYTGVKPNGFGHDFSGSANLGELQEILRSTVMVRRLKRDVLKELPPKRRQIVELDNKSVLGMIREENQKAARFREINRELLVADAIARTLPDTAEYKEKLRRLKSEKVNSLREFARARRRLALAKANDAIDFLKMYVDNDPAYKILVFCHHRDLVEIIYKEFQKRAVFMIGGMTLAEKQRAVDDFQERPDIQLFVGTIGAAGEGHTLTAAAHVVFVELDPTPARLSQAEDRSHRIGQKSAILVQHLVFNNSLDVTIARAAIKKQEIADQALDDETDESSEMIPETFTEDDDEFFEKTLDQDFAGDEYHLLEMQRDSVGWQIDHHEYKKCEQLSIDAAEYAIVHKNMKLLAAVCDGGEEFDGKGFNRFDAILGHQLAQLDKLNKRQFYLAKKLSYKYRKQLAELNLQPVLKPVLKLV